MTEHTCWWCDQPATVEKVVIPEDRVTNRVTKKETLRKAAVKHWVCDRHARMIDREVRMREVEHDIGLAEKRLYRNDVPNATPATQKRAMIARNDLKKLRAELAELRAERDGVAVAA